MRRPGVLNPHAPLARWCGPHRCAAAYGNLGRGQYYRPTLPRSLERPSHAPATPAARPATTPTPSPPPRLRDRLGAGGAIPGWLRGTRAGCCSTRPRRLPPGARVLEIGSHQGRSTVVLARGRWPRGGEVGRRRPVRRGPALRRAPTRDKFEATSPRPVSRRRGPVAEYSTRLRPGWTESSTSSTSTASTTTGPSPTTCAGALPPRGVGPGPRRLLLDRRDARGACACSRRPTYATFAQRLDGAVPRGRRRHATGGGCWRRCPGGCATSA